MPFNCPDIETFKTELDNNVKASQNFKGTSHATIKIQSLLNITIYTLATRFLEGSIKLLLYNYAKMRGDSPAQLSTLESNLKSLNNPEYSNIRNEFLKVINFDISQALAKGRHTKKDISLLNEVVMNRHRNVHATHDPGDWYSTNIKDIINDFPNEYQGLLNILSYLDSLKYDTASSSFVD